MNTIITVKEAIRVAVNYAGLENDSYRCVESVYDNGLYMLTIQTSYQRCEFYVDADNSEVIGYNSEPLTDLESLYDDEQNDKLRTAA